MRTIRSYNILLFPALEIINKTTTMKVSHSKRAEKMTTDYVCVSVKWERFVCTRIRNKMTNGEGEEIEMATVKMDTNLM